MFPKLSDNCSSLSHRLYLLRAILFQNESRELLASGLERVDEVINRLNDAARKADREDKKRCIRLSDAIRRLSSDLFDLANKWNSDSDQKFFINTNPQGFSIKVEKPIFL